VFDDALARAALWTSLGGRATNSVHAGVHTAFQREFARWHSLLDGAAMTPEPTIVHPARL